MAGRFRFRLEVVERVRRRARDEQRRAVAHAVRAVQQVEWRIARLGSELSETMGLSRGTQSEERLDIASLRGHHVYRGYLHRRILESQVELGRRQSELQAERDKLAEASKRLKVIEKLRERHWNRHLTQLRREEQAIMDEISIEGFSRRRNETDREVLT